ncbi:hypothetical protein [Hyphomonas oceanitis]|uniref:hypothetical protein n=1 Tax=Hyphomonas oceanitis TaxID=81033 RepID=UPI0030024230
MTTFHNKSLHDAFRAWDALNPILACSLQLNRSMPMNKQSDVDRQRTIASVKRAFSDTFQTLEKAYFHTPHITERISKRDRISGVGVVEKTPSNPHGHMAITFQHTPDVQYDPHIDYDRNELAKIHAVKMARQSETLRKNLFICFMLEQCNSPGVELEERDREFLEKWKPWRGELITPQVIDWKAKGWTIKTTSIYDAAGLRAYIFKEQLYQSDFSDQIFTLADFHSSNQRTEPTRYYTVDRITQHRVLNLDEPFQPRR